MLHPISLKLDNSNATIESSRKLEIPPLNLNEADVTKKYEPVLILGMKLG